MLSEYSTINIQYSFNNQYSNIQCLDILLLGVE